MSTIPAQKENYMQVWEKLLVSVAGWSRSRVHGWITHGGLDIELDRSDSSLYHGTPQYWVSEQLVPEALRARLAPREWRMLKRNLREYLDSQVFDDGTDWRDVKRQVEEILAPYAVPVQLAG